MAAVKQPDLAGVLLRLGLVRIDGVAGAFFGINIPRSSLGITVAARGQRGLFVVVRRRIGLRLGTLGGSNMVCRVGTWSGVCTKRSVGTRGGIDAGGLSGSGGRALSRGPA